MEIDWQTARENPGTHDPRFGVVAGERRFAVEHAGADVWHATDESDERAGTFCGAYMACVEWCWSRLEG